MAGLITGSACSRFSHFALCAAILVVFLPWPSLGCFPVQDVFKSSCLWIQTTSMQSRNHIAICPEHSGHESDAPMTIEPEGVGTDLAQKRTWKCLRAFREYRYLVEVSHSERVLGYRCVKFSPLTDRVVRQEKTAVVANQDELACEDATYLADEAVLISSFSYEEPRPCVLAGGFQLLMNMGESLTESQRCRESITYYKPQIQFQCDRAGSPNALLDLGMTCTPRVVKDSQSLRGRYVSHLRCLDSWQENKGTSEEFTSVLLVLRDSYRTYLCLHAKHSGVSGNKALGSSEESLYQAFLTFDGRCLKKINGKHDVPKDTSMFGNLASFVPGNSTRCQDKSYLGECRVDGEQQCTESLGCPSSCGRCKEKLKLKTCSFPEDMRGSWESFSFDKKPRLVVEKTSFHSPIFGKFQCRYPKEFGDARGMYAVVQSGVESTCMPYYSCAQMISLAPGLLSFQKRPALRDVMTGNLYSCQQTHAEVWMIRPERAERTVTLLQRESLENVSCHINEDLAFPSIAVRPNCQLLIHKCSGPCKVFKISLEAKTCQNMTAAKYGLYINHTCVAKISFDNGDRAIVTNVPNTDKYFCLLFHDSKLLILTPDACNQGRINDIYEFEDDQDLRYDPVYQLVETKSESVGRGTGVAARVSIVTLGLFLALLALTRDIY